MSTYLWLVLQIRYSGEKSGLQCLYVRNPQHVQETQVIDEWHRGSAKIQCAKSTKQGWAVPAKLRYIVFAKIWCVISGQMTSGSGEDMRSGTCRDTMCGIRAAQRYDARYPSDQPAVLAKIWCKVAKQQSLFGKIGCVVFGNRPAVLAKIWCTVSGQPTTTICEDRMHGIWRTDNHYWQR